ncbi:hypothetical protein C8Q73DRAFT_330703 [Cubamyces lactineus]|nr:hypothetical protein C8Q73DRAFT_330703 [Cubamyces lactineus]
MPSLLPHLLQRPHPASQSYLAYLPPHLPLPFRPWSAYAHLSKPCHLPPFPCSPFPQVFGQLRLVGSARRPYHHQESHAPLEPTLTYRLRAPSSTYLAVISHHLACIHHLPFQNMPLHRRSPLQYSHLPLRIRIRIAYSRSTHSYNPHPSPPTQRLSPHPLRPLLCSSFHHHAYLHSHPRCPSLLLVPLLASTTSWVYRCIVRRSRLPLCVVSPPRADRRCRCIRSRLFPHMPRVCACPPLDCIACIVRASHGCLR